MNQLVFFGLIILLAIRLIGLGTSLNFYYDLRSVNFLYFIFGWIFGILGNTLPFVLEFVENIEFILVMNALLALIHMIFLVIGVFSYFLKINFLKLTSSCIIIATISILLYIFLDHNISISFSVVTMNSAVLIGFIFPLFRLKKFKKNVGKSIRWYYITGIVILNFLPISFLILIQGEGYGLYYSENVLVIILNYTVGIVTHILLLAYLTHLEYTISNERENQLKDKYSHNLGNIMQVIYSSADLLKRLTDVSDDNKDKLKLIEEKCKEASKLINEIRNI
jgi:hypothetical protein